VQPTDVSVLDPSPDEKTLTLVTCYPFYFVGNAPKRFIVRALQAYSPIGPAGSALRSPLRIVAGPASLLTDTRQMDSAK